MGSCFLNMVLQILLLNLWENKLNQYHWLRLLYGTKFDWSGIENQEVRLIFLNTLSFFDNFFELNNTQRCHDITYNSFVTWNSCLILALHLRLEFENSFPKLISFQKWFLSSLITCFYLIWICSWIVPGSLYW